MSENTLKKLTAEAERLDDELKMLKDASNTLDACNHLVKHMETQEEPFAAAHPNPNPWHTNARTDQCCTIM